MKNLYIIVILFFVMLLAVSCTKPSSVSDITIPSITPKAGKEIPEPTPLPPQNEYVALVESYIDEAEFKQMDASKTKQLSDMLLGHYNITGRTAGNGMDYYLAFRRTDAPIYSDFDSVNIGYYSGPDTTGDVLQIGYYDKEINSTILYEIPGYLLLEMPLGNSTLDCFCLGISKNSNETVNQTFHLAFTQSGRDQIDFIKDNPGLSFYSEDNPSIEFYYQDDDTLKFFSSPYSCYINISKDELDEIRAALTSSHVEKDIKSRQDAWAYLQMKDSSIHSTGATLHLDGIQYVLLGNSNTTGYMMSVSDENEFLSLEYNETIYNFVISKIKDIVKIDYDNFDSQWFKPPLKSASIDFPERVEQAEGSYTSDLRSQIVTDVEKLKALSKLMDKAINSNEIYGFSGCPYVATIIFTREDGETLRIFIATDSCDSLAYEGRIGFEYGNQFDMATIFDDAMAYRIRK